MNYESFNTRGRIINGEPCDPRPRGNRCDPEFQICLRYENNNNALFNCSSPGVVSPQITTARYDDNNNVEFGRTFRGTTISNPVEYATDDQFDVS